MQLITKKRRLRLQNEDSTEVMLAQLIKQGVSVMLSIGEPDPLYTPPFRVTLRRGGLELVVKSELHARDALGKAIIRWKEITEGKS